MAKTKISEFSSTPGNNTDIDSINIAEGCAPSGINNAIRELMAQLKDFQTGTAGDSFNGPIGTTTAATGAFTTLSASGAVSGVGFSNYLASPPAIGGTAAAAGAFTTLTTSGAVTHNAGTANGVAFLNGSKVLTTGSALVFDGTNFANEQNTASPIGIRLRNSSVSTSAGTRLTFEYGGSTTGYVGNQFDGSDFNNQYQANRHHIWLNGATEKMRLTSTGLGIGNSSPTAKLDVTGTAAISGAVTLSGGTANGVAFLNASKVLTTGTGLEFNGTNFGVGTAGNAINNRSVIYSGGINAAYQQIANGSTGLGATNGLRIGLTAAGLGELYSPTSLATYIDGTEQMRLTSTGLGIGTSSPGVRLHVASSGSEVSRFATTGADMYLRFVNSFDTNGYIGYQNAAMTFWTANTERMRLDSSGNLGLGVTPSAWGNGKSLQGDAWALSTTLGFDCTALSTNARQTAYGGTANWAYRGSATAALYTQQAGSHIWLNAPSGTAGNAISFNQAMTLEASGNLLVGATSGAGRLTVFSPNSINQVNRGPAGQSQGDPQIARVVRYVTSAGSSNKLVIPFFSQGFLNSTTVCRVMGHNAQFNTSGPKGFDFTFAVGHLNALYSLAVWGTGGNYSSIAINGMNVEITFTANYAATGGEPGGLFLTLDYMSNNISYSIQPNSIVMA